MLKGKGKSRKSVSRWPVVAGPIYPLGTIGTVPRAYDDMEGEK
jgi:hypothetical protein